MPGLVPAIHVLTALLQERRGWPGTSPTMTESEVVRQTALLRRHHRHTMVARAHRFRSRREIQRRAASIGATAGDHQPAGTCDDVPLAKRRIIFDFDRRQTDLILAVARASRDELLAIAKRIRQF